MNPQTQTQEALLTGNWNHESVITPNTITFNRIKPNSEWVMRITPDRRIEVNENVEVEDAAQKVLDALQILLNNQYQHTWKSLNADEIDDLWAESSKDVSGSIRLGYTTKQHYFYVLIEQALKEKNKC